MTPISSGTTSRGRLFAGSYTARVDFTKKAAYRVFSLSASQARFAAGWSAGACCRVFGGFTIDIHPLMLQLNRLKTIPRVAAAGYFAWPSTIPAPAPGRNALAGVDGGIRPDHVGH